MKTKIKGNKELAKQFLEDVYHNDKNNNVIDSYLIFRNDNFSVGQLVSNGSNNGICQVYKDNWDDVYVFLTNDDIVAFALKDEEWLEDVSNECVEAISEWLESRGVEYEV